MAEPMWERKPPPEQPLLEIGTPHERADLMHRSMRCARHLALAQGVAPERATELAVRATQLLWESLGTPGGYDPSRPLDPYVATILRNLINEDARREDNEDEHALEFARESDSQQREWMDPSAAVRMKDLDALYLKALRTVPKVCREVFVLKKHKHLSDAEIAHLLGIAEGTVRVHVRNGTKLLASQLYPHLKEGT